MVEFAEQFVDQEEAGKEHHQRERDVSKWNGVGNNTDRIVFGFVVPEASTGSLGCASA